jgi:serine/threonine protein kinase
LAGDHAFRMAATGGELTEDRRKGFLDEVDQAATSHFEYYWRRLDRQEQYVLANLSSLEQDERYLEVLRHLRDQCLIAWRNGRYAYFSPLFEAFVQRQEVTAERKGLIGRTIGGARIVERIGSGALATVYRAYHPSLDRYVAVKVVSWGAQNGEFVQRFQREATVAAGLKHPNILRVRDFGYEDDLAYIITDFVSGGTLADLIFSRFGGDKPQVSRLDAEMDQDGLLVEGRPSESADSLTVQRSLSPWLREAISIAMQVGEALHYVHERGFVHRDVKPTNILMAQDGKPLLTDFGLVKHLEDSEHLTEPGAIGTVAYIAPEQTRGDANDPRIDIYSLGTVLYEMVTGHLPFESVLSKLEEPPLPPRKFNPSLPIELEDVILKAMGPLPASRYLSRR